MVTIQFSHPSLQLVVVAQQLAEHQADLARQFREVQVRVLVQVHHHRQQVLMEQQVKVTRAAIVRALQLEQVAVEQEPLAQMLLRTHQVMVEQVHHHQLLVQPLLIQRVVMVKAQQQVAQTQEMAQRVTV
jgi:hypothetical protein